MASPEIDLVLVLGVDGSGKTTFLNRLNQRAGYELLEPTSTAEAREFKASTLDTPLDDELIDERERLYIELNRDFDQSIAEKLSYGSRVATTGSTLVTAISHCLMKNVIGSPNARTVEDTARQWLADPSSLKPSNVSLVHARTDTLMRRILERQAEGDVTEKFWGFNSPFFLMKYQEAWLKVVSILMNESDIACVSLNTSELNPDEMMEEYFNQIGEQSKPNLKDSNGATKEDIRPGQAIIDEAFDIISTRYGELSQHPLEYHGIEHTKSVMAAAEAILDDLSKEAGISERDRELLLIAAAFHDTQQLMGSGLNESMSADLAVDKMESSGRYTAEEQERVRAIIMATQVTLDGNIINQNVTDDILTKVMADADLSMLGQPTNEYWFYASRLFMELNPGISFDNDQFYAFIRDNLLVFLRTHKFHTAEAEALFNNRAGNIEFLEKMQK